ncbi:3'-5' exonuclease [Nocardioides sp. AX2bis]|uniref:3'-5' exonuclease n=1 Tax=Nocardioides sp. AX2bis TaxID=2653157 RepID=UPI0013577556|nr:3'-5' exonuclease [Nocardioides sp. AX2bis]
MFTYAGLGGSGREHAGPYAVIDFETTGLSPDRGDRVIEIAVSRVDASGRVGDEFATLVNPEGRDTGPVFIHGISNRDVAKAPTFAEIVPELLARLDGAVVVAHNAPFEERFLTAELARAGHLGLRMPALCTLWLGRKTFQTPNHKLGTIAREAGLPLVDKHAALGDVRAVSQLLPLMLHRHGSPLRFACPAYSHGGNLRSGVPLQLVTRAVELRKGTDGWMHSLMSRLPMSANDADDSAAEVYLEALGEVLADGKIVGDEAKSLARLAGDAGMGGEQVRALNERFLEAMREAALADEVLTPVELRGLNAAARALSVPDYFDDLSPTAVAPQRPRVSGSSAAAAAKGGRRCGHCRVPGHYRSTCPELV